MRRWGRLCLCASLGAFMAGCPKGKPDFNQGKKAETLQDYDAAFVFYQKAVKADPYNAGYKIKLSTVRFEASELHVKQGVALRKKGDLQGAAGEFERAQTIDPSNPVAEQELRKTVEMIAEKNHEADAAAEPPSDPNEKPLASSLPELKILSRAPISLSMDNDAKIVFETLGKLAGLTVIFDPDFPARRISTHLNNVTMQQALDIVSMESKAFIKVETENIIFVIPDQTQKRRDYEEEVVKTLYISNTVTPQELTEIVTALRQLLDVKRIQPLNSQNAIVVRDTPDKIQLAEKMIKDIDKARPEVVIQVEVLEARTDRLRDLGILPGQTASISINPNTSSSTTTSTAATTLNQLRHLSGSAYDVTLPSLTANAVLTDTNTKIIQNPEVRSVDGQTAKLKIGDRIPIATGSFSSGLGVAAGTAGGISPLVNTQFTYIDVGVIIDLTPRVHPNRDVSLKLKVEVSSHTGDASIGGITQPIISQRIIEDDIRLKEGEVSILGGLVQRTDSKTVEGWPGLAKLPLLKYFFSHDKTDHQEDEVLIVLTPRIVRMPEWTKANLQPMYSGSESFVQVRRESDTRAPVQQPPATPPGPTPTNQKMGGGTPAATPPPAAGAPAAGAVQGASAAKIRFEPQSLTLKVGQKATIGILIDNVNDLVSIPLLLQYNPAVISVEEVQHGGFLSGGNQEVPYVQQIFPDKGQAIISATRGPNTQGVSGSGTLMGIVVKALAPGTSNLSVVQVNAKDSQQRPIPLISSEATLQVQQ